ncbi:hypothetical protein BXZ70DRAFT_565857 [Cristinia sonorae]|uniref:Heterokaryon incompatibility domain-containing protein n=1 Tax=Cristinia sonorae TaxID=1940300 RepID=A0A8K0UFD4_9AGAR|nr:hypothetical protein BXZ70DRAFT_565857 [Cristinia sonorae]
MDFRLLVKHKPDTPSPYPSIVLEGALWTLTDSLDIHSDTVPKYTCVSYVWGYGRAPNPIHPSILMSDHTLPVLRSAIRNSGFDAFWIDAFCVPVDPIRKGATLESMGFIYGRATKVVAVLAPRSFVALKQMYAFKNGDVPSKDVLDALESEVWIKSVWTYQEVVNSAGTYFVGEDTMDGEMLDCVNFLNGIGFYQTKYRQHTGINTFEMRKLYPNLDTFEDLAADWILASYAERSALEIMTNVARRSYDDPKNYFYSMIGALIQKASKRTKAPSIESLAETFMALSEEKGDYSFIFSSLPRDTRPGLEWRPRPQQLPSVLSWHVDGEALVGVREPNGIRLKDMLVMKPSAPGTVSFFGKDIICRWLEYPRASASKEEVEGMSDTDVAERMRTVLGELGFSGSGQIFFTNHGYAFLQEDVPAGWEVELWITTGIYYVFGAPVLAVARQGKSTKYIPGVYGGEAAFLPKTYRKETFIQTSAARL